MSSISGQCTLLFKILEIKLKNYENFNIHEFTLFNKTFGTYFIQIAYLQVDYTVISIAILKTLQKPKSKMKKSIAICWVIYITNIPLN